MHKSCGHIDYFGRIGDIHDERSDSHFSMLQCLVCTICCQSGICSRCWLSVFSVLFNCMMIVPWLSCSQPKAVDHLFAYKLRALYSSLQQCRNQDPPLSRLCMNASSCWLYSSSCLLYPWVRKPIAVDNGVKRTSWYPIMLNCPLVDRIHCERVLWADIGGSRKSCQGGLLPSSLVTSHDIRPCHGTIINWSWSTWESLSLCGMCNAADVDSCERIIYCCEYPDWLFVCRLVLM